MGMARTAARRAKLREPDFRNRHALRKIPQRIASLTLAVIDVHRSKPDAVRRTIKRVNIRTPSDGFLKQ